MGYRWHATMTAPPELIAEFLNDCENARYKIEPNGSAGESEGSWYEVDADFAAFSKLHPGVPMSILGEGEEPGDIFRIYARGGKVERIAAKVVHPDPPRWYLPPSLINMAAEALFAHRRGETEVLNEAAFERCSRALRMRECLEEILRIAAPSQQGEIPALEIPGDLELQALGAVKALVAELQDVKGPSQSGGRYVR